MTIFFNNIKRIFQKKSNILFLIIVPIVANLFIVSVYIKDSKIAIGILDYDQTTLTKEISDYLGEHSDIKKLNRNSNINEIIINNKAAYVLEFEKDFTKKLIAGEDVKVKSYGMDGTVSAIPLKNYAQSMVSSAKKIAEVTKGDEKAFYQNMDKYFEKEYRCTYNSIIQSKEDSVDVAVASLGYVALSMVFFLSFSTMLILEDKISGVYNRLITSPQRKSSYMLQHLLSNFLVALLQIVILLTILPKIVEVSYGENVKQVFSLGIVCACFAACFISIGIVISRYANTAVLANAISVLINLPMLMLGGCLWPRTIMPETLQKIGEFLPTTWFLKGAETILYGNGLHSASRQICYMIIFILAMQIVAFSFQTSEER